MSGGRAGDTPESIPPMVEVYLLGRFRVVVRGQAVAADAWRRRKARQLFKALLSHPRRSLTKDEAIELLWPESDPEAASTNLRSAIHAIRRALDEAAGDERSLILVDRDAVAIRPGAGLWVDADAFDQTLAAARAAADPLPLLEQADALYTGNYLPDDLYEDWATERREALKRAWVNLQLQIADHRERRGDLESAARAFQRRLDGDPCDEHAARELMRLLGRQGRRSDALRAYQRLVQALRDELGVAPSQETVALEQQLAAGQPGEPTPARAPDRHPPDPHHHNLPAQATALIGREQEVAAARDRLLSTEVRLLTLTGPGGTGKTRLGLQVAADLLDRFADGVYFVPLAPVEEPARVPAAIAQAVGVHEDNGRPLPDRLRDYLRDKELLLLLDNFEQVLPAAPTVAELLGACPRLKVLATSRSMLHLYGEHDLAVPPLKLPARQPLPSVERLSQYEAIRLFVERARAVRPEFAVTTDNAPAVAEICHRLDGLPLAIELAAARGRLLTPQAILARLDRRLPLLTGGAQDLPARQQTLRGAIAWSYDLLDPDERALFRRLAAFVGGCTLEAAEAVCHGVESREPRAESGTGLALGSRLSALDLVASLVDKSLLRQEETPDGEPRVDMLGTIREYALELLEASGESDATQRAHAEYYAALAAEAATHLRDSEYAAWLDRLELEHDNLRPALRWLTEHRPAAALELVGLLWRFWSTRGHLGEGREWLTRALQSSPRSDRTETRAEALTGAATLAYQQGDYPAARALHEEGLAIRRELGDRARVASSLAGLGDVLHQQGDYEPARVLHEESLAIRRALGDRRGTAAALDRLGLLARVRGDYAAARTLYEESLATYRALGESTREALVLNNLGRVAYYQGDDAAARRLHEASLARRREVGDKRGTAISLSDLADVLQRQGDHDAARALLRESLTMWQELGDRWGLAYALEGFASLAAGRGQPERGVRLIAAATTIRGEIGAPRSPVSQARLERLLEAARAALGRESYTAAWAEGRAMSAGPVVAYALERSSE